MIKNEQITELDALTQTWEDASNAAITAQNERDAELRLYMVGLGEPADSNRTELLETLWGVEAARREELESFVAAHMHAEFDQLSLMHA